MIIWDTRLASNFILKIIIMFQIFPYRLITEFRNNLGIIKVTTHELMVWELVYQIIVTKFYSQWAGLTLALLLMELFCTAINKYSIIIIIYSFRVFDISVSWWFFTGVWVTASLLKSPGLVSGFWPFSAMLSFGYSLPVRQLPSLSGL